jgi:hypothetical protein
MDNGMSVDVVDASHDALPEFLFRCHADVSEDGAGEFGEESLDEVLTRSTNSPSGRARAPAPPHACGRTPVARSCGHRCRRSPVVGAGRQIHVLVFFQVSHGSALGSTRTWGRTVNGTLIQASASSDSSVSARVNVSGPFLGHPFKRGGCRSGGRQWSHSWSKPGCLRSCLSWCSASCSSTRSTSSCRRPSASRATPGPRH